MLRLFVLVGMMVLFQDTMMQLIVGTLLAVAFLLFQVQASPYVNLSDDLLASALSFCVVAVFLCSYAFKDAALTGLQAIQDKMSIEQRSLYILNQATLSAIMVCGVIAALVISGIIFIFQLAEEAARVRREALASKARRLRYVRNDEEVDVPDIDVGEFHLFLSHVWGSGQDQMRIVKTRLLEMLPHARIFLDVDDLTEGKGAEFVDASAATLIFVSAGYFTSPNCLRELLRAVVMRKPMFSLVESEEKKGGLTLEEVRRQLIKNDVGGFYHKCGLAKEVAQWGHELPTALELYDAIFKKEPIEWARIGFFQEVSMRLIANHIVKNSAGETYLQGEVSRTEPKVGPPAVDHAFHVYCSVHNTGAANLVREVAAVLKLNLKLTSDVDRLDECDCMLVYLTRLTWTQGDTSVALAADVQRAMDGGVPLKLAHEMPGVLANEERRAVDFGAFFSCEDGTTPQELLRAGIYNQIAIALKGGPWRRASLVMIASAFAQSARASQRPVTKRLSTSAKSLLRQPHTTLSRTSKLLRQSHRRLSTSAGKLVSTSNARLSTSAGNLLSQTRATLSGSVAAQHLKTFAKDSNASSANAAGAGITAGSRLGRVVAFVAGGLSRSKAPVVSATKASASVEVESSSHSGVA
mmetsp:Transcript_12124/g.31431  ORF Transcript_12124/g.31431 Transcript_12124/m.31431 type:complete len:638 (-) Transcript_12124:108-2021(-)